MEKTDKKATEKWPQSHSSFQFSCSFMSNSLWPHGLQHARLPCPSPTPVSIKLMSIEMVMPSNHLILCHPLLLLPSIFPITRVFSNESALHITWPKYWSFKLISIESVMPSNHLILCRPLLLLPSIFPITRVFSNESALHITWPKYWSFSFNISPSNEHSGLISFRMDWMDLLSV